MFINIRILNHLGEGRAATQKGASGVLAGSWPPKCLRHSCFITIHFKLHFIFCIFLYLFSVSQKLLFKKSESWENEGYHYWTQLMALGENEEGETWKLKDT